MGLLIGEDANSILEGTEYGKDTYYNNSAPEYVDSYEKPEWVNLQKQLKLFQEEVNLNNIITSTKKDNFSWKALLIHGLHLSGRIQQEYQKIHSLPSVSHQKSVPIKDTGISPYRYYEDIYSNSSGNYIIHNDNTTLSTLIDGDSTYAQDVYSDIVRAGHKDIIDKGPDIIDIFESSREHQYAKSGSNSYIEVDQEVTMPIVVATSTSLMGKGWKYCLGGFVAIIGSLGLYSGYKWVMDKIGSSEKEEVLVPIDTEGDAPQTAMIISGEKHLGVKSKYDVGIRNIDFQHLSIDDMRLIESKNSNKPSENKFCITLDDLQYDNITAKDSKLGLQDAITSSMEKDFYNSYLHPYLVKALGNTEGDINAFNQYVHNNIINDILDIVKLRTIVSLGSSAYLHTFQLYLNVLLVNKPKLDIFLQKLEYINKIIIETQYSICPTFNIDWSDDTLYDNVFVSMRNILGYNVYASNNYNLIRYCIISDLDAMLLELSLDDNVKSFKTYFIESLINAYTDLVNESTNIYQELQYLKNQIQYIEKLLHAKKVTPIIDDVTVQLLANTIMFSRVIPNIQLIALKRYSTMSTISDYPTTKVHSTTPKLIIKNDSDGSGGIGLPIGPVMLVTPIFSISMLSFKEILSKFKCLNNPASVSVPDVMVDIPRPEVDESTINKLIQDTIKEELDYLEYQEYSGLDLKDELPQYIRETTVLTRNALENISQRYRKSIQILDQFISQDGQNHKLQQYLGIALDTDDPSIKLETAKKLRGIYQAGKDFLIRSLANNYKNIKIISTIQQSVPGTGNFEFASKLPESSLRLGAIAFTIPTKEDIYIVADRAYVVNHESLVPYKHYLNDDISETLIHEISHITSYTQDYWYLHKDHLGLIKSAEESLRLLKHKLTGNSRINPIIYDHIAQYSCVNHKNWNNDQLPDTTNLNDFLASNPRLKANIIVTNADNVALILRDTAKIIMD